MHLLLYGRLHDLRRKLHRPQNLQGKRRRGGKLLLLLLSLCLQVGQRGSQQSLLEGLLLRPAALLEVPGLPPLLLAAIPWPWPVQGL